MLCLPLLSSLLFDLASGHAFIGYNEWDGNLWLAYDKIKETPFRPRNYVSDGGFYNKQSYRNINNTGAPCGGKSIDDLPSTDGPSSAFFGSTGTITPGGIFKMQINFTINHGGFHFAAVGCTKGKAPSTESFLPNVPPFWTVLKLSAHQPSKAANEAEGWKYMTCDTYIPKASGQYSTFVHFDIPADLSCQAGEEAMVSWIWEASQNACTPRQYANRCGQSEFKDEVFKGKETHPEACALQGAEVWYNCTDVTVGEGASGGGRQLQGGAAGVHGLVAGGQCGAARALGAMIDCNYVFSMWGECEKNYLGVDGSCVRNRTIESLSPTPGALCCTYGSMAILCKGLRETERTEKCECKGAPLLA